MSKPFPSLVEVEGEFVLAEAPLKSLDSGACVRLVARDIRQRELEILAIYHSHPTTHAVPSKKDLAQSFSDNVINFIISLQGAEPVMRGWWLRTDSYDEATWSILGPSPNAT